ncbi:MAG: CotH kinase family protein, partial [Chloroflexota bacterium]
MYALNIDPLNPKGNPTTTELQELGAQAVRFTYKDFSSGDQLDPQQAQFYKAHVQQYAAASIHSLVILTYETYPGAPNTADAPIQTWQSYIDSFVARVRQIAELLAPWQPTFQIWNEPDLPPHPTYIRSMTEALYGQMLARSQETIKAVNSNLQVMVAGLGSGNWNWLNRVKQSVGGSLPADSYAIHPYGQRPEPTWPSSNWGFGYVGDLIRNYQSVTSLPLVISEIGEQHLSQTGQAEYLRRFYRSMTTQFSNVVSNVYWFCYSDGMVSPYGLVDNIGQRKEAYFAFRELAATAPPTIPPSLVGMQVVATVSKADYDNLVRNNAIGLTINAEFEIDDTQYTGGELGYRDANTLNFPKKGIALTFSDQALFQGSAKQLDLSASYADKSLIRERLSYDLFATTTVVTPNAWHVDFIIRTPSGEILERSLYTAIEHIDTYFFRSRGRTIGSLYQANGAVVNGVFTGALLEPQVDALLKLLYDKQSANVLAQGAAANLLRSVFKLALVNSSATEEDYSDFATLLDTIAGWDADTINETLDTIFESEAYLDWLAINTLIQNNDVYDKNYYIHKRVEGGKWEILPGDNTLTWGRNREDVCGALCGSITAETPIKGPNQIRNALSQRVLNNAGYFSQLRMKLANLLGTEFTEAKLFAKIDAYYDEVTALAHLDTRKWPSNSEFDQERAVLKDWVRQRRRFLMQAIGAPPTNLADTIVLDVSLNQSGALVAGVPVTFSATVQNIGGSETSDIVGVAFLVDRAYVTFGTTAPLAPGATQVVTAVSSWSAVAGEHTLTAIADDINRYPEDSEENNARQITFQVNEDQPSGLSDVVVTDLAAEPVDGDRFRLAALVKNEGQSQTADIVGVAFFVDDQYATFGTIDPLAAGQSQAVRSTGTVAFSGSHKVTAIVDDINRFAESNEQNNTLVKQIDFGAPEPQLADTIIVTLSLGTGRFSEGDLITFE